MQYPWTSPVALDPHTHVRPVLARTNPRPPRGAQLRFLRYLRQSPTMGSPCVQVIQTLTIRGLVVETLPTSMVPALLHRPVRHTSGMPQTEAMPAVRVCWTPMMS